MTSRIVPEPVDGLASWSSKGDIAANIRSTMNGGAAIAMEPRSLEHQIHCYLDSCSGVRGLAASEVHRRKTFLLEFLRLIGHQLVMGLRAEDVEAYIRFCREKGNQPRTLQAKFVVLASFFKYLVRRGLRDESPCDQVDRIKVPPPEPWVFSREQIDILLSLPDLRTEVGLRDWALMVTLLGTGARIGELLQLKITDVDFQQKEIVLRAETTKTRRKRVLPLAPQVKEAIRKYLARRDRLGNLENPFLFASVRPSKKGNHKPLTRAAIEDRLDGYTTKACIAWDTRISPHTFRHTFATQWIINKGDVESLSKILGHRNPQMLAHYVNLAVGDLQRKSDDHNPLNFVDQRRVEELRKVMHQLQPPRAKGRDRLPQGASISRNSVRIHQLKQRWDEDE